MNASSRAATAAPYHGDNKLILGIVLAVVTFWLFAQTTLNVAPAMRADLRITDSISNIAKNCCKPWAIESQCS
jgi:DHA2 family multidrug resistance protein-like MFS transporter